MKSETHTSYNFSKWLFDKGFVKLSSTYVLKRKNSDKTFYCTWEEAHSIYGANNGFRAYDILNDLCNKYAKEIFGEEIIIVSENEYGNTQEYYSNIQRPRHVLKLIQQGKKEEAEKYIMEKSILTK